MMLYDAGWIPPYQDRLSASPGWWRTKEAHAYWAARSPVSWASHSAHTRLSSPATSVAATSGRLSERGQPGKAPLWGWSAAGRRLLVAPASAGKGPAPP